MNIVVYGLAAYYAVTGLYLIVSPLHFYSSVPGLSQMGPFNLHFIRDVGLVFMASAGAMAWGIKNCVRSTAVAGATWPFLHAVFHLQIWAGMRGFALDVITLSDFIAVVIPGFLAVFAALKMETGK